MSIALSRYLKDFGAPPPPQPAPVMPDLSLDDAPFFPDLPETPPIDVAEERREAYAEGHEAASQQLTTEHQAAMDAVAAAHAQEIEALHAKFEGEIAERIGAGLKRIAAALAQSVSVETTAALAPVMTDVLTAKAVAELGALVEAAILDGAVGQLTVAGPLALFKGLSAHLGENAALLHHIETDDIDLTVTIGENVLVTRMSAWAEGLREVLG